MGQVGHRRPALGQDLGGDRRPLSVGRLGLLADAGDLTALRKRVNGGVIGLDDANARISQARAAALASSPKRARMSRPDTRR